MHVPRSFPRLATAPARRLQWIWAAAASVLLLIFGAGAGKSFEIATTLEPATRAMLATLGLPVGAPATYLLIIDTLAVLIFAGVATLLVLRRPRERMAWITASMLILTGLLYTAPAYEAPLPTWVKSVLSSGAEVMQVAFLFAFPSGRFVPRWTPWALIPIFFWRFAIWNFVYLPNLFALQRGGESYPFLPQDMRDIGAFLTLLLVGVGVQIYRYHRLATSGEQQQVKWLLGGIALAVGVVGLYVMASNWFGALLPPRSEVLVRLAGRTVRHLALVLVPISLLYSILRYKLWAIDHLLSLTAVWSAVSTLLALLFGGSVLTLQVLLAPDTQAGSTAVVAGSTLLTVLLARPLYRRLQGAIDRRFYRPAQSARSAAAELRARLREPLALDALAGHLLLATRKAWQPHSVTLWVPAEPAAEPNGRSADAEPGASATTAFLRYRLED